MEFEALLALVGIGVSSMMLTAVGAAVIAANMATAWFVGRAASVAALSAISGVVWLVICWRDGSLAVCLSRVWQAYDAVALHQLGAVWLSMCLDPLAWQTLPSISLIVSAVAILLNEDRLNSPIRLLLTGAHSANRTALWTRLVIRRKLKQLRSTNADAVLGVDAKTGETVALPIRSLQKAVLAVGRSGSGKTTTLTALIEWALANGHPATVVNGKGDSDFGDRLSRIASKYGRPFYRVDMHQDTRTCYVPLAKKDFTVKADMIVGLREVYTEEHYKLLQTEHAQTMFRVIERLGLDVDLASLPQYMSSDQLLSLLRRSRRRQDYQELANSIMAMKTAEDAGIDSLRASVSNLVNSSFATLFDTKKARTAGHAVFDLETARQEGALTYFGAPSLLMPTAARSFTTLLTNDVKATLARSNKPWLICFDELASVGASITNIVNQGRGYGAMCLIGCQSFSDMRLPADPDFIHRVIASVNGFIFHEMTDPDDTELAANIIGTQSLIELTAQLQGSGPTGAASARSVREFKFHPDVLKNRKVGEAVVVDKDRGRVFGPVLIRAEHL